MPRHNHGSLSHDKNHPSRRVRMDWKRTFYSLREKYGSY